MCKKNKNQRKTFFDFYFFAHWFVIFTLALLSEFFNDVLNLLVYLYTLFFYYWSLLVDWSSVFNQLSYYPLINLRFPCRFSIHIFILFYFLFIFLRCTFSFSLIFKILYLQFFGTWQHWFILFYYLVYSAQCFFLY